MQASDVAGLFLLFAAGKRPTRAALKDFISSQRSVSLTHDPMDDDLPREIGDAGEQTQHGSADPGASAASAVDASVWVEVLSDGLTFDLIGLAPGPSIPFPFVQNRFDLEANPTDFQFEAVQLVPGLHLVGGERTMPVVKGLVALARDITHHFSDIVAIVWPPAQSAIGRRFFESVTTAWLDGGAFPALGLTAFRSTADGALQSVGLEFWIGQELRIEPPLSADKVSATRLGVRLVNQLILVGGLEESERIVAPDGTRLIIRPSPNRRFVRVSQD